MADIKVVVDSSDLQLLKRELVDIPKKAKDSASVFEREFKKVEATLNKSAVASQKYYKELLGLDKQFKSASSSASIFQGEFAKQEKAIQDNTQALDRMRVSYDRNYAVEQRTLQLKRLLRQEIANGNMTVREAGAELLKYRKQLIAFNNTQMAATKGGNRFGVVTQQAGYQVSDFIVQVQSGTNAFVAFGQQASQLVGVLPLIASPLGLSAGAAVALSAGLGIAIPLVTAIGAAFSRSSKEAEEATGKLDDYAKALENLNSKAEDLTQKRLSILTEFDPEVLKASEKRISLANRIAELNIEALQADEEVAKLKRNLIKTLEEELDKESQSLQKTLEKTRKEEERLAAIEAAEEKALKLEEGRAKATADRFNALMKSIAENNKANERAKKQQEEANKAAKDQLTTLYQQNAVLEAQIKFGKDSEEAQTLQNAHLVNNLRLTLEKQGVDEDIVDALVAQKNTLLINKGILSSQVEEARKLKEQLQAASKAFTSAQEKAFKADVFDPRGEEGLTATEALRRGIEIFEYSKGSEDRTKKAPSKRVDPLANLREQLELEQALLGQTDARKRIIQALGVEYTNNNPKIVSGLEKQIVLIEEATKLEQERLSLQQTVESALEDGFISMVDGTKTVGQAFKDMARQIIAELYRVMVVQRLVNSISGVIFPSANGNVFSGGSPVTAYANGGIVGSPTYFPMSGGRTGLMGEAGPEAIMPLKRGKNGKLGVQAEGGTGDVTIHQSFNFAANGDDSVKKIIAQEAPKIAQMTQQQILDSRRRGGQMKAVFG